MNTSLSIAVIGLGNLGWNLSNRLHECGFKINQVCTKHSPQHEKFIDRIGAERVDVAEHLSDDLDLVFLCVPDDAIHEVADQINTQAAVIHCSGSTPLLNTHPKTGVLYAFQTFTKYFPVNWSHVPIFIESEDEEVRRNLVQIGAQLSGNVQVISSHQRKSIHIAGVYGANFVNHLLYQAHEVLKKEGIELNVLDALLAETIRKAMEQGPAGSQTGPAKRGDERMIQQHLEELRSEPELRKVYELLTRSIQDTYSS